MLAAEDNVLPIHFAQLWNKSEKTQCTLLTGKSIGIIGGAREAMSGLKSLNMIKSGNSIRF